MNDCTRQKPHFSTKLSSVSQGLEVKLAGDVSVLEEKRPSPGKSDKNMRHPELSASKT